MNNSVAPGTGRSAVLGPRGRALQPSGQERMFFDSGASVLGAPARGPSHPVGIEGFSLRHLKTPSEIEKILHLREAIDLSVHSHAGVDFVGLEKKETSADSSARSNCAGKS